MKSLVFAAVLALTNSAALADGSGAVGLTATKSAPAVSARTIDMTTVLTDLRGKPILDLSQRTAADPDCAKCGPLTLGMAVAIGLLTERRDEPNLSAVDKAKRGMLALRLLDDKAAVLNSDEMSLIVRLSSVLPPLVLARVVPLIDPARNLSDVGAK